MGSLATDFACTDNEWFVDSEIIHDFPVTLERYPEEEVKSHLEFPAQNFIAAFNIQTTHYFCLLLVDRKRYICEKFNESASMAIEIQNERPKKSVLPIGSKVVCKSYV